MKRTEVADWEDKDIEQELSRRGLVVRKGWDDEFLNESYMGGVRRLKLLTRAQEIELGKAIERRFGFNGYSDHTLEEIAKIKDLSRERIRQIEKEALAKLRTPHNQVQLNGYV